MKLNELAAQYRHSGKLCQNRAKELREAVTAGGISEQTALELRRQIRLLSAMGRDALAISKYLDTYYDHLGRGEMTNGENDGGGGFERASEVPGAAGDVHGGFTVRGSSNGADGAPAGADDALLHKTTAHDRNCRAPGYSRLHREQDALQGEKEALKVS